jgi:opacity protein-like surface antigen
MQSQSTAPYLIVKTSYGFPASPQLINETEIPLGNEKLTTGIYGSYAKGAQLSLGMGKMLNSTLGVELSAQYMLGNTINTNYASELNSVDVHQRERIRGLVISPLIVLRNSGDLLSIYTKLGPAIAVVSNRLVQQEIRYNSNGQTYFVINEAAETAKPKIGLAACFGLSFRLSEAISFFTEVNAQILSLPITRGSYTRYEVNGTNKLSSMPVGEKSWVYQPSGYFDKTPDPSYPETRLYTPAYYSSVGIGIGLIYHFQ